MTPAGAAHIPSPKAAKEFYAQHLKRTTGTIIAPRDFADRGDEMQPRA